MLVGVLDCLTTITVCRDLGCLQGHSRGRTPNQPLLPPSTLCLVSLLRVLAVRKAGQFQSRPALPSPVSLSRLLPGQDVSLAGSIWSLKGDPAPSWFCEKDHWGPGTGARSKPLPERQRQPHNPGAYKCPRDNWCITIKPIHLAGALEGPSDCCDSAGGGTNFLRMIDSAHLLLSSCGCFCVQEQSAQEDCSWD